MVIITEAQKRVTNVAFCAFPTLEGSDCAISGDVAGGTLGQLTCGGSVIGDGTEEFLRPATLNSLVGDHLSQLRSGACGVRGVCLLIFLKHRIVTRFSDFAYSLSCASVFWL